MKRAAVSQSWCGSRAAAASLVLAAVVVAHAPPADAHRLDEYLQTTRIAITTNRISLEVDLTPGIGVAPRILTWIDTNNDGGISEQEGAAYARQVLAGLTLSVDDRDLPLTLVKMEFPDPREVRAGTGTVRLDVDAPAPSRVSGSHRLSYLNTHYSGEGVYLVNALVPDDPRVQVIRQQRDRSQHGLAIDYDVTVHPLLRRVSWLAAGSGAIALLAVVRRRIEHD